MLLPNEDFLRAAEALRLHNFVTLDPIPDSPHYLDGLEHYAAQYEYPPEITERLGTDITIALFPASLVGWKLVYIPVLDAQNTGSFTTSLAIQKIPMPVDYDVEHSCIELSRSSSVQSTNSDDGSVSTARAETDDEYVVVRPYAQLATQPVPTSPPMERGNGNPIAVSACDITDMKAEPGTGAVEMLPGHKMIEKTDAQLIMLKKGIYVPRLVGLKESFENTIEFMRRDGRSGSKFAKVLQGWASLLECV